MLAAIAPMLPLPFYYSLPFHLPIHQHRKRRSHRRPDTESLSHSTLLPPLAMCAIDELSAAAREESHALPTRYALCAIHYHRCHRVQRHDDNERDENE